LKTPAAGEPVQFLGSEAQAFEIVEGLFQAGRNQEIAAGWPLAYEELEAKTAVFAMPWSK